MTTTVYETPSRGVRDGGALDVADLRHVHLGPGRGHPRWDEPLAREASLFGGGLSRREASRYMSKRQSSQHPRYSNSAEGSSKFTLGEGSTTGRVSTRGRREILQEQLSDAHVPLTEDPNVRKSELEAAVDEEIHKIQEQAGRLHVNLGTKDELRSFFQRGVSTRTVELDLGLVEQANSALKAHTSRKGMEMARHLSRRGSVKRAPTAKKEELQSTITGTLGKQQSFKAITRATSMSFTFVNLFIFILFVGVGVYIYARFGGGRTLASGSLLRRQHALRRRRRERPGRAHWPTAGLVPPDGALLLSLPARRRARAPRTPPWPPLPPSFPIPSALLLPALPLPTSPRRALDT